MTSVAAPVFRTKSVKRRGLAAASGGTRRQLRRIFGDELADRLDVMPELVWSDARTRRVLKLIDDANLGPALHSRFRSHPGQRCSFEPTLVIAAVILGVMSGLSAELTDVVRSINALPPWARHQHGVHSRAGNFVSYSTLHHQFTRLVKGLEKEWEAPEDGTWGLDRLVAALFVASPTTSDAPVTAASMDGYVVESWVLPPRNRIPKKLQANRDVRDVESFLESDHAGLVGIDEVAGVSDPVPAEAVDTVAGHPIRPRKREIDTGAGWGVKTETRSKAQGWVFGHELHIAREVVGGSYRGDPTTFTLEGERPMGRITGFDIRPISRDRAGAGLAIVAATKDAHPELREVIVDRGYSNLKKENFRGPLEEMGVASVHSLMPDDLVRQPAVVTVPCGRRSGTGTGKQSVTLLSTAGSLFHELTPPELLENPRLGITGTQQRKDAIEHYEKRTAYLWAPHGSRSNGRLRLKCPVHSGRLRPLDPIEAARTGRFDLPALSTQPGITKCCVQATITITADERDKVYQEVPFGTRAYFTSYGRRNLSESTNSLLHSQLARIVRGFTRVQSFAKTKFLLGLALVAINLMIFERHSQSEEVVIDELAETVLPSAPLPFKTVDLGRQTFHVPTSAFFSPPQRT